jgi:hypothetical protein
MSHYVEIRNSKFEIRKKPESRRPKGSKGPTGAVSTPRFVASVSDFGSPFQNSEIAAKRRKIHIETAIPSLLCTAISQHARKLRGNLVTFGLRPSGFGFPAVPVCAPCTLSRLFLQFAFGFRVSAFFRPSGFGLRASWVVVYLSLSIQLFAADTNGAADALPSSLKPPRAEILPTFWELYGAWIIFGAVLLLAGAVFTVWLKTRPKPATPVPFAVVAREQLEQLKPQPESGAVLSWSSQILRHYIAAAFALPADEATTTEFSRRLQECERIGPALANQIGDFLRDCDLRKFAPSAPAPPFGAVSRSLSIIESSEARLAELNRSTPAS